MNNINEFIQLHEVGDVLYKASRDTITEITIIEVKKLPHLVYRDNRGTSYFNRSIVKSCFKTREEAEQEIYRQRKIREKRELLKKYERELNEKFGLENHLIIK